MSYGHGFPSQAVELKQHYEGEVRQAQIATEAIQLGENTEVLLKMIEDLSIRINAVLRPEGGDPLRHNEAKAEPLAPHADFLRGRNSMLRLAITQLESILRRIEL